MTATAVLYIGNRNYSSWSLRAWLALSHMQFPFTTERLLLDTPDFATAIAGVSGAGRVPVLRDGALVVWDSLAICEYVAERASTGGWPLDPERRAHARAGVAEMHAGFSALRGALPMNIRARRRVVTGDAVAADIARLHALWREARNLATTRGPWLYGDRSIADAFFAPVLMRFETYGIAVPDTCEGWRQALLDDPALTEWCAQAAQEQEILAGEEVGAPV